MARYVNFNAAIEQSIKWLKSYGVEVAVERWQGYKTESRPDLVTLELMNLQIGVPVGFVVGARDDEDYQPLDRLQADIQPNLPWADNHFDERVQGYPMNPDPSYVEWPWAAAADKALTEEGGKFTHTYSERFWPREAGAGPTMEGIRFEYGDLNSVVDLLYREPYTRQAYLPIFFPEDTGTRHGGRIPCTIGYHFMLRLDMLQCPRLYLWYHIRSCDAVRHFRDDLYLAARLQLWMIDTLHERELRGNKPQIWVDVDPGTLHFTAYSFHVHKGDLHRL